MGPQYPRTSSADSSSSLSTVTRISRPLTAPTFAVRDTVGGGGGGGGGAATLRTRTEGDRVFHRNLRSPSAPARRPDAQETVEEAAKKSAY